MKKGFRILLVLVVLGVLAFVVYRLIAAPEQAGAGKMISEKVRRLTIQTTISSTGTLSPMDTVNVGTQVSGDISKIYVDFNSKVKKGQVIAELDRSKLQATLYQAEIAANSAKIDYEHKLSVFNRTKKLAETNSASAVDLETAEYEMNSAKLSWETRKSEVKQAKLNLSYCIIKSPIDGVVLERSVDVGQTVAASMSAPTLFILAKDLSKMRVMADVDEADIGQVKAGQKVSFTVDAFQNDRFDGTVELVRLNPKVTSNVVTYTVVISADNPDLKLLPGMTATCTIVTEEVENTLSVPVAALHFAPSAGTPVTKSRGMPPFKKHSEQKSSPGEGFEPPGQPSLSDGSAPSNLKRERKGVWINIDGNAEFHPVKTGLNDGVNVQILKGLSDGDSVVVRQESVTSPKRKASEAESPFMPGPKRKKR